MSETSVKLQAKHFQGVQSFAIDFGGSVLKIAYLSDKDSDNDYTTIKCVSFARAQFPQALEFIKSNCHIPKAKGGELPHFILTGVGVHEHKKKLEKELGIRSSNQWEGDCFNTALLFLLEHLPDEQLYHPPLAEEKDEMGKQMAEQIQKMLESMEGNFQIPPTVMGEDEPDQKQPFILVTLGSAFVYTVMFPGGKMINNMISPRGGRMFLGLGSILSGAKTFEELMELAEMGDDRKVNVYSKDLMKDAEGDSESSQYSLMKMDMNVFGFGWAVGKTLADFKREDLIRALLVNLCTEVVSTVIPVAKTFKISKIILCGGFSQSTLPRTLMEKEFSRMKSVMAVIDPTSPLCRATFQTLSAGSYLGALGALIRSKNGAQPKEKKDVTETRF